MKITNPIITGFNPDPSICAVGDDFYIATSTFEWFPGVQIHHSKDLKNWRLLTRPLNRVSQLDMKGCLHSAGIWAPCLTHDGEQFHLVCANVRSHGGTVTDSPVYLFTAKDIEGEWSDGVKLGANGFDPSIFHDTNGKKYLVNMEMGSLETQPFNGITLQEYCPEQKKLIGSREMIWKGTELGISEGPHMYQKDGWYYLLVAEGGTGMNHAVTVARSKELLGPYEVDPEYPMLTSAGKPDLTLQAAGHGDFFQTPNGDWYMVHLCKRYLQKVAGLDKADESNNVAILGRETSLQKVVWSEGEFPRLACGGNNPFDTIEVDGLQEQPWNESLRDDFEGPELNKHFQFLREPADDSWLSLKRKPGMLSIKGRASLHSAFEQSFVGRRLQHFKAEAQTCIHFSPYHPKQEAGLIAYNDGRNFINFRVSCTEDGQRTLSVLRSDDGGWSHRPVPYHVCNLPTVGKVYLKMTNDYSALSFAWSLDGENWSDVDKVFDSINMGDGASCISGFTGTFWGLSCQDTTGDEIWAEFEFFEYTPL